MKEFDKATAQHVANVIQSILDENTDKLSGFQITQAGGTFGQGEFKMKLNIKMEGAKSQEEFMLEKYAVLHGLDINKRGSEGERLVGFKPRARKRPYVYKAMDGKRYVCTVDRAKAMFGKSSGAE